MNQEAFEFISRMPHFSFLPEEDRRLLSENAREVAYANNHVYAAQGKTFIEHIFIIRKGALALFDEKDGKQLLTGYIRPGEVFGGITILLNAGISLRTVMASEDTEGYLIPKDIFQDLATKYSAFYEYFLANFSKHVFDESLSAIIETGQAIHFLAGMMPFSFLPMAEIERIVSQLSFVQYPKDTVLFAQGSSRVGYLYVLHTGSAEKYYEENHKKTMQEILTEGDLYGGISMLMNDGISVRTLRMLEKSYFYLIPKSLFMEICQEYSAFREYFTDIFGKRIMEKSYASMIAKTTQSASDTTAFFNQHVASVYSREPVFCDAGVAIREAAGIMAREKTSVIFVRNPDGECTGVITERDLTRRVVATGQDTDAPVSEIMSSPVTTIPEYAMTFEALMTMLNKDIRHAAVTDADEKVVGVLTTHDMITAQGQSPFFMIRDIAEAATLNEIIDRHNRLPHLVRSLISSGAQATNVNRVITTVSDSILRKLISFALEEHGPPPVNFVFMIMGSEGRSEQTLKTDQDNAIIFEDVDKSREKDVFDYFLKFGDTACTLLDQAGYDFCTGDVMAKNPKWCQPLSKWKQYFQNWIHAAQPEDLLQASIFFDFRLGYGDQALIDQLRTHLFNSLGGWSGFFRHLTENALHFKPPIGFFRNFVVESKGEHRNAFDIKSAMTPIVDFARIYALKHKVEETNTLERLKQLKLRGVFTEAQYDEMEKAYSFLMQLRFVRQVTAIVDERKKPDNYINPKKLTRIEQKMLKEIFARIEKFQTRIEFEFIGVV